LTLFSSEVKLEVAFVFEASEGAFMAVLEAQMALA
jgi:hypothetical protein